MTIIVCMELTSKRVGPGSVPRLGFEQVRCKGDSGFLGVLGGPFDYAQGKLGREEGPVRDPSLVTRGPWSQDPRQAFRFLLVFGFGGFLILPCPSSLSFGSLFSVTSVVNPLSAWFAPL